MAVKLSVSDRLINQPQCLHTALQSDLQRWKRRAYGPALPLRIANQAVAEEYREKSEEVCCY